MRKTERMVYYDDGNVRMVWDFWHAMVFVHLEVKRWGPSVYRLMKAYWPVVVSTLKAIGYERIHAFYQVSNTKMAAFAGRFGFRELRRTANYVLLEADCA